MKIILSTQFGSQLFVEVEEASAKSTLRELPDMAWIENFIVDKYGSTVYKTFNDAYWRALQGLYEGEDDELVR